MDQSSVTAKAFALQASDSGVSLSSHGAKTWHQTAVRLAAWFEIVVGASFVLALNAQSQLIFGATPEGSGVHFARLAGIALISLGIACLPSKLAGTRQVAALLIYNIAVAIFFAWVALTTPFRGVLLWAVVTVHAVISIVLALSLRKENSTDPLPSP